MREYVRYRAARLPDVDPELDAEDYLARTVHESHELIDIGILDEDGNRIMARQKMDAIGFVRWRET